MEVLILGGFASFGAKIIAIIFNTDISEAGYLMGKQQTMFGPNMKRVFFSLLFNYHFFMFISGLTLVFGSGGGMLFGGYIIKRFDLKLRSIIRFCCACQVICMCFGPVFLASCPSQPVIGVSAPYPGNRFVYAYKYLFIHRQSLKAIGIYIDIIYIISNYLCFRTTLIYQRSYS